MFSFRNVKKKKAYVIQRFCHTYGGILPFVHFLRIYVYIIWESFRGETINVCSPSLRLADPPRFAKPTRLPCKKSGSAEVFRVLSSRRPYKAAEVTCQIRYLHAICRTFKKNRMELVSSQLYIALV